MSVKIGLFGDILANHEINLPRDIDVFVCCGSITNYKSIGEIGITASDLEQKLNGRKMFFIPASFRDRLIADKNKNEIMLLLKDSGIEICFDQNLELNIKQRSIKFSFKYKNEESRELDLMSEADILLKYVIDSKTLDADVIISNKKPYRFIEMCFESHFIDPDLAKTIQKISNRTKYHVFNDILDDHGRTLGGTGLPDFVNCYSEKNELTVIEV